MSDERYPCCEHCHVGRENTVSMDTFCTQCPVQGCPGSVPTDK